MKNIHSVYEKMAFFHSIHFRFRNKKAVIQNSFYHHNNHLWFFQIEKKLRFLVSGGERAGCGGSGGWLSLRTLPLPHGTASQCRGRPELGTVKNNLDAVILSKIKIEKEWIIEEIDMSRGAQIRYSMSLVYLYTLHTHSPFTHYAWYPIPRFTMTS